jgi:hypothetical protein
LFLCSSIFIAAMHHGSSSSLGSEMPWLQDSWIGIATSLV